MSIEYFNDTGRRHGNLVRWRFKEDDRNTQQSSTADMLFPSQTYSELTWDLQLKSSVTDT